MTFAAARERPRITVLCVDDHRIVREGLRMISSQTVRVHVKNIYAKLGVGDRTEAMSVALRRGIVHID